MMKFIGWYLNILSLGIGIICCVNLSSLVHQLNEQRERELNKAFIQKYFHRKPASIKQKKPLKLDIVGPKATT